MNRKNTIKNNFKKHCKCIARSTWCENGKERTLKIDSTKKFKKSIINELKSKNLLPLRANFLWYSCYNEYTKRNHKSLQIINEYTNRIDSNKTEKQSCTSSKTVPDKVEHVLEELIFLLEEKSYDYLCDGKEHLWEKLTGLIGEKLCKEKVYKDGKALQTCYKNKSFSTNLNILRFIKERNKLLVCFLCGVSGLEFSVESEQIQYAFASTLGMCYYLRNLNLVLPRCFLRNLVESRISGSKSVSVVNGKTSPGGDYQTLRSWLERHGTEPLQCGKGTIDIFFDNIGKYVIKNHRMSTEKIKTADIITTCIQIAVDDKTDTSIQKNKHFKPKNTTTRNIKAIHSEMENKINKANNLFRIYRYNFLENYFI